VREGGRAGSRPKRRSAQAQVALAPEFRLRAALAPVGREARGRRALPSPGASLFTSYVLPPPASVCGRQAGQAAPWLWPGITELDA